MFSAFRPIFFRNSIRVAPIVLGACSLQLSRPSIHNDAIAVSSPQRNYNPSALDAKVRTSSLGKSLDYGDLCMGSVTGIFLGIIIGKLSSAIVFLSVSSYLLLQFLENRGIINIPWTSVISIGKEKLDLKTLLFNKPCFKVSFVSTFLLAAWNI